MRWGEGLPVLFSQLSGLRVGRRPTTQAIGRLIFFSRSSQEVCPLSVSGMDTSELPSLRRRSCEFLRPQKDLI